MNGLLRSIASVGPWAAPIPSSFFVSRSIYLHLLANYGNGMVKIPTWLNVTIAVIAGLSVEILAVVSVYNGLALHRWQSQARVKRDDRAWERAPFALAVLCTGLYLAAVGVLLILLEAYPEAAKFAPILFPLLGIVAAVNLGILDQHRSRLTRYGLTWDLESAERAEKRKVARTQRQSARISETAATGSDWQRKGSGRAATQQRASSDPAATGSGRAATGSDPAATGSAYLCRYCKEPYRVSDYGSEEGARNARNAHQGRCTERGDQ